MSRIISPFLPGNKPKAVARWEHNADNAETDQAAQTQLLYEIAVQIRVLKVLLAWLLLIILVVVCASFVAVASSTAGTSVGF